MEEQSLNRPVPSTIDLARLINPVWAIGPRFSAIHGTADRHGNKWAYVTDSRMMVAVRRDDPPPICSGLEGPTLMECLGHASNMKLLSAPSLMAWLEGVDGSMPGGSACTACHGEKTHTCICDECGDEHGGACPECEGEGVLVVEAEPDLGVVLGRARVAQTEAASRCGEGNLWVLAEACRGNCERTMAMKFHSEPPPSDADSRGGA